MADNSDSLRPQHVGIVDSFDREFITEPGLSQQFVECCTVTTYVQLEGGFCVLARNKLQVFESETN